MDLLLRLTHPSLLYTQDALSPTFVLTSLVHLSLGFVLLGICASEYLCPNVAKIVEIGSTGSATGASTGAAASSAVSSGVLMAILLSWCNSAPDLFSNLMGWTSTHYLTTVSLSLGEVLGACGIILCIVMGVLFLSMAIGPRLQFSALQVANIERDLRFVLLAMAYLTYVTVRNKITVLDCVLMTAVYMGYVYVKFRKWGKLRAQEQDTATGNDIDTLTIKPSLISAMDFTSLLVMLERSSSVSPENAEQELISMTGDPLAMNMHQFAVRPSSEPAIGSERMMDDTDPRLTSTAPGGFVPYHDDPDAVDDETAPKDNTALFLRGRTTPRIFFTRLLAPHLFHFRRKSTVDAILSILTTPFVVILQLSCPKHADIVDHDTSTVHVRYSEMFVLWTQCILSPLVTTLLLACLLYLESVPWYLWVLTFLASGGLAGLLIYFQTIAKEISTFSLSSPIDDVETENKRRRRLDFTQGLVSVVFLLIGIVNSIMFISLIANALVELMELYQRLTDISKAILGLTVFAWGNSIGDLLTNIAMCRLYLKTPAESGEIASQATRFFVISIQSCLGGVMLNSMISIGISGIISLVFVHRDPLHWWFLRYVELRDGDGLPATAINYKFLLSCIAILVQVILLLILFKSNKIIEKWSSPRYMRIFGISMCTIWGLTTLSNVLIEIFA
ncbi:Ecm27p KNAG_0D01180 [Huiozyma naganishii CBS 8797]|uniref:Sodium/calcium exchanger membrane region domain-containing protein n=1 Tax=Huiozyma naganishii (strain ATCC MYA-139 / BCRC 22969 / CBS 8797 / KCTC 17520 / NBRC 10181 / NCYC 3082 / Yp74L-3) TaxID=1071383 RepID=J7R4U9_HUIN7|nr:hypothetical protein KNAG_0D01180 [Kazachstania naganishii CBS 8797]CCK69870.1 hypothetical protein KNAG_0D01180 [Kazachstania naganishii CBS 8797]